MTFAARQHGGSGAAGGAGGLLSVSVSPAIVTDEGLLRNYTTLGIVGTVEGGVAPYTYSWSIVSALDCFAVPLSPTASTSAIRLSSIGLSSIAEVVARLTVTDADGTAQSDDTSITYTNTDYR